MDGVADANEVIAMNPDTLQIIAAYSVPFPEAIAPTEGEIWVESIPVGASSVPTLVKIDPQTGIITDTGVDLPGERLEANPSIPGQLLSWSTGSPEVLELFSLLVRSRRSSPPTSTTNTAAHPLSASSPMVQRSSPRPTLRTISRRTAPRRCNLKPRCTTSTGLGIGWR